MKGKEEEKAFSDILKWKNRLFYIVTNDIPRKHFDVLKLDFNSERDKRTDRRKHLDVICH